MEYEREREKKTPNSRERVATTKSFQKRERRHRDIPRLANLGSCTAMNLRFRQPEAIEVHPVFDAVAPLERLAIDVPSTEVSVEEFL